MWRHVMLLAFATLCVGLATACTDDAEKAAGTGSPGAAPAACRASPHPRGALATSGRVLAPLPGDGPSVFGDAVVRRAIDDDPRDVLPGLASREISHPTRLTLPDAAREPVHWRIPLRAGQFEGVDRFVVVPRAGITGVGLRWLPPVMARADEDERGRHVAIEVDLAGLPTGRGEVSLAGTLLAAPLAAESIHETEPLGPLPESAWLEVSFGVLDAGVDRGPVRFRLEACRTEACACLHDEVVDPSTPGGRGWHERAIRLDGLEAAPHTLRFVAAAEGRSDGEDPVLLAEWARPRLLVEADESVRARRSLILISLDTLRADHLGVHGYDRETSPFVDGWLAPRATVFERAIAPATATGPSHMTMFTGFSPAVHGVTSNLSSNPLPDRIETLAEILRERGYVTASINENGALSHRMGFDRGFDHHRQFFGANVMKPSGFVAEVFDEGLAFLERHPSQRFFLFLHTYEVHSPYAPPRPYRRLFADGDDPKHPDNLRVGPGRRRSYPVRYDREIRYVDDQLERLFAALDSGGWLDDAIVVVTSDHGEAFGEHGTFGHGSDVFEESLHVPLIAMGPGVAAGRRVAEPVGLLDLMPTLLEWVGVAPSGDVMGRSFARLAQPDGGAEDVPVRPIVSESWTHSRSASSGGVDSRRTHAAYRLGSLKLIRAWEAESGRVSEALYDLDADPAEEHDLLAGGPGVAQRHASDWARLRVVADTREAFEARFAAGLGLDSARPSEADTREMSPERLEALRMLGYVE